MECNSQVHLGDLGIVDRIVGGWLIGWPGAGVGGALAWRRGGQMLLGYRKENTPGPTPTAGPQPGGSRPRTKHAGTDVCRCRVATPG